MSVAKTVVAITLGMAGLSVVPGCVDRTPPPPNSPIPPPGARSGFRGDEDYKPIPRAGENDEYAGAGQLPPPPFNDVPLVTQETPEQPAFVEAYNAVGRPRMVVFVNRTLEGQLIPVNADGPVAPDRYGGRDARPNDYGDRGDVYLRSGQYDEALAKQIDYEAVETILTDWLAAGGRTEIVSPVTARQRLTDEQVKDLQSGRPRVMGEIARELDADVLIQVTAKPTRQTERGLEIRLVAEAINLGRGGQSIGRAVVDVPPPLDKPRINKFTRFLARGLMDRMTGTWENLPPPRDRAGLPPAPEQATPRPRPVPPAPSAAPAVPPAPAPEPAPIEPPTPPAPAIESSSETQPEPSTPAPEANQ